MTLIYYEGKVYRYRIQSINEEKINEEEWHNLFVEVDGELQPFGKIFKK